MESIAPIQPKFNLNIKGELYAIDEPKIMGILNLTPDSFYDGGHYTSTKDFLTQTEKMLSEGADIIDLGAMSSRPFSKELPVEEELTRVQNVLPELVKKFPNTIFSIDTYRSRIAEYALDQGVSIINDITAGMKDEEILHIARKFNAPYIAMHMQGMPENMQVQPHYQNVIQDVMYFFGQRLQVLRKIGLADVILDVGFGFGKSQIDNYSLLKNLAIFQEFNCPILVGLSRKSMIYKCLDISPQEALNGTSALHFEALRNGAQLLRVHDVKEAREVVKLFKEYQNA
jgi:dihydropteroate synthase